LSARLRRHRVHDHGQQEEKGLTCSPVRTAAEAAAFIRMVEAEAAAFTPIMVEAAFIRTVVEAAGDQAAGLDLGATAPMSTSSLIHVQRSTSLCSHLMA